MMKNSTTYLFNILLMVFILFGFNQKLYSQTPVQATIENTNPSDPQILEALNGGGMTLYLDTGDGLVRGVRNRQIATFSNGEAAGFGMEEGILFTTGRASEDLASRNNALTKSFEAQSTTYSDSDLTGIFNEATRDVVIYKFKVTLADHTSAIRAVFQFGSEEYPDYVGSVYNDAFGFFVRPVSAGATLPGGASVINMARLPYSNNPISINTVNYGYAGSAGSSTYPGLDLTQSEHYIVNGHSTQVSGGLVVDNTNPNPAPIYIEYNGLTNLITYDLINLTPGETYEFKIAIADAGDTQYDSGVMIKRVQGTTGADVKIEKIIDMMDPGYNDEVKFTLTASNLGPYDATGTLVNDLLPSGYTYVSHTTSKGTYDPNSGEWNIGNLQAIFEEVTLEITATVNETGEYMNVATITSDEPDPDLENNLARVTPNPLCFETLLFYEDFGISNPNVNSGRTTTPYMPLDSYSFGTSYPSGTNSEARIDNGHYAVVSPLYIKDGWDPNDLSNYFWTPGMLDDIIAEAGAITDISGTLSGAALAINTNNDLDIFYQRDQLLDYDDTYRYSFWMYLVEGPAKIAIDIRQKSTGKILGTYATEVFSDTGISKGKWTNVQLYFSIPPLQDLDCEIGEVVIELRNDLEQSAGSRFYIDNIGLTQLGSTCPEPADPLQVDCPIPPPSISNPMLLNRARQ